MTRRNDVASGDGDPPPAATWPPSAPLPGWLLALPDAEAMRASDAWAIEQRGIAGLDLMERAGEGLARVVQEVAPEGLVVVVCGKGNNGGDGYVVARLLREAWREVRVLALAPVEELRGDARANAERVEGIEPFAAGALEGAAVVVDAVLGTGFEGAPRGAAAEAIAAMCACDAPLVAADVPSGVDASTGEIDGEAVRAVATATFAAPKPGLWINPGKTHAGEVHVVDIGIPGGAPVGGPQVGLIDDEAVLATLPRREAGWTKFKSGHVLVAGGARGLTGAPLMASEAAARTGAGYVTACVPASLQDVFAGRLVEVMTRGLPDADGAHTREGVEPVLEAAQRGGALVLGPGIGRSDGARTFARELARRAEVALLLDADGLNAHAGELGALAGRRAPTVLTPHAGELGRLLGIESAEVEAHRLRYVREAAAQAQAVVVLKGDDTLVAAAGGLVGVSAGSTGGLATAGTGDVLSGVVAALLARGVEPFTAACAGVRLHARAGLIAAAERGADGLIARDVIEALPYAWPEP